MRILPAETVSLSAAIAVAILLLIAGWLVIYAVMRRALERKTALLSRDMEAQLLSLRRLMHESSAAAEPAPAVAPPPEPAKLAPAEEAISPELVLVITAAVTAYLGKKVRIRSAKRLQTPYEIVNPWSQQGRVFIQASHNIAQRGY
jgi:methylmalonyl-CoA carboxyltransferase large subunit